MPVIRENRPLGNGNYLMTLTGVPAGKPGQFLMLRTAKGSDPLLPRPISLLDTDETQTALCYRVVGRGTKLLSELRAGEPVEAIGPLGNGFPLCPGNAVLIGGGLGIAPLYALAKALRAHGSHVRIHLGYSGEPFLQEAFEQVSDALTVNIGGYVTDGVDFTEDAVYYACGPAPMLHAAKALALANGKTLYVSLEARMGCGVGACLACSIRTKDGNKCVCRDGPVFDAMEVLDV